MPPLNCHSLTHTGRVRSNNEDCFLSNPAQGLWAVADGMGGHEAGEVASAIVKQALTDSAATSANELEDAILQSHTAVLDAAHTSQGSKGMGSTVVALLCDDTSYSVSWVGDSRAYLWTADNQGGQLEQLTTDHSYVQMLLSSGAISAEDVHQHPDKNIITQCIGAEEPVHIKVDTVQGDWGQQQWLLLCSDGLTDEVDNQALAQILCDANTPKEACERLLQAALDNGGHDNITIQIVESPLFNRSLHHRLSEWLPRVTGRLWLDTSLYGLALISAALISYWTLR